MPDSTPTSVRRVLVVDDDRDTARVLAHTLISQGHDVTVATSADEAIRAATLQRFDLILLDWMMPHGGGKAVLDALHGADRQRRSHIAILSAKTPELEDRQLARETGAVWAMKTFEDGMLKTLLARLQPPTAETERAWDELEEQARKVHAELQRAAKDTKPRTEPGVFRRLLDCFR